MTFSHMRHSLHATALTMALLSAGIASAQSAAGLEHGAGRVGRARRDPCAPEEQTVDGLAVHGAHIKATLNARGELLQLFHALTQPARGSGRQIVHSFNCKNSGG